jgi:hypothetical protein
VSTSPSLRRLASAPIALALVLSIAGSAAAGAFVDNWSWTDEVIVLGIGQEDCLDAENVDAELTLVSSGVGKYVESGQAVRYMVAARGSFILDPVDPALPTYTGTFSRGFVYTAGWASGELREGFSERLAITGTAPDGSRLVSIVGFHAGFTPTGMTHEFLNITCGA